MKLRLPRRVGSGTAMLFLTLLTAGCGFLTLRKDIEQTSHKGILSSAEVAEEFNAILARAIAVKR